MRNKKKIIITIIGLLVGILLYLFGMYLAGYPVLSWFWNSTAWLVYALIILGGLTGVFLWEITKKKE